MAPCPEGWFDAFNMEFLAHFVGPGSVVVEIGAWLGKSTLWLASAVGPAGHVYTIDHFKGSQEHHADPRLSTLWETFVVNCWDSRERISPVRLDSRAGLLDLHQREVWPTLVYVDGAHDYETVVRDVLLAAFLWPDVQITGDDFDWPTVRAAVADAAKILHCKIVDNKRCFALSSVEKITRSLPPSSGLPVPVFG